jgi:hypothetical protein
MLQTVSRLLIAEARVPSQAGSRQIFSGQNGTGTGFFLTFCTVFPYILYGFPCQYHSTCVPYHSLHQHVSLTGISGRNLGTYQNAAMLRKFLGVGWSRCFSSLKGQGILFPGG